MAFCRLSFRNAAHPRGTSLKVSSLLMYKQVRYLFRPAEFSYLRTLDGKEVDALIELPEGYFAFKIKMAERAVPADARSLRKLGEILDKPLLHSFVLSNDPRTRTLGEDITAVHAAYFLG